MLLTQVDCKNVKMTSIIERTRKTSEVKGYTVNHRYLDLLYVEHSLQRNLQRSTDSVVVKVVSKTGTFHLSLSGSFFLVAADGIKHAKWSKLTNHWIVGLHFQPRFECWVTLETEVTKTEQMVSKSYKCVSIAKKICPVFPHSVLYSSKHSIRTSPTSMPNINIITLQTLAFMIARKRHIWNGQKVSNVLPAEWTAYQGVA